MKDNEKLKLQSHDWVADNQHAFTEFVKAKFPNCITEGRVDMDLLRQEVSSEIVEGPKERYRLEWAGKREAIVAANTPTNATLRPIRTENGKEVSVNFDTTENIYIEGDNLEVLKLLQESYLGKIKMIYIDPPYNTGNEFVYKDDFSINDRKRMIQEGVKDEEGFVLAGQINSQENTRYHSNWLSMMYPRLKMARTLLSEDGVIFISIDDHEVSNLKKLCDEIFGEINFVAQLIWQRAFSPKNDAKFISNNHDYVLVFAKSISTFAIGRLERTEEANARYSNPDNDPRGVWTSGDLSVKTYSQSGDYPITTPSGRIINPPSGGCWRLSKKEFEERVKDNRIWFGAHGDNTPRIKRFLSDLKLAGMAPTSIMLHKDVGHSQEGAKEVIELFDGNGVFDGPKPVRLLERLITLANLQKDSIVLDFFSGSASTAHALLKNNVEKDRNCRFILVQLPETVNDKVAKAGYKNICEIGEERIRRAAKKIQEENPEGAKGKDMGFRVFRLDSSNMKEVKVSPDDLKQTELDWETADNVIDNIKKGRTGEDLLFQVMLAWGLPLSLPVAEGEIEGKKIYRVEADGVLILLCCFENGVNEAFAEAVAKQMPMRVLFRDSSFSDDNAKENVRQLLKQLSPNTEMRVL